VKTKDIAVTLAWASPNEGEEITLTLPQDSTIRDALVVFSASAQKPIVSDECVVGIWGKVKPVMTRLRDGDRIEIYRALQADPKDARRARHAANPRKIRP
jgi:uncharacterized protein